MDRAYIVEQLQLIVEKFGLDISEDAISAAVGFSEFKVYSKGQLLGKIGEGSSVAGIVMSGVVRSFYVTLTATTLRSISLLKAPSASTKA